MGRQGPWRAAVPSHHVVHGPCTARTFSGGNGNEEHTVFPAGHHRGGGLRGGGRHAQRLDHHGRKNKGAGGEGGLRLRLRRGRVPELGHRMSGDGPAAAGHRARRRGHHQRLHVHGVRKPRGTRGGEAGAGGHRPGLLRDGLRAAGGPRHGTDQGRHPGGPGGRHVRLRQDIRHRPAEEQPVQARQRPPEGHRPGGGHR